MKKLELSGKKTGLIRQLLYFLIGLAIFLVLNEKFTFGFVPLFILLGLFLIFPLVVKPKGPILYAIMTVVFGGLSMHALNNYINPEKEVFANNDHHALRLEGIIIDDPVNGGFLLAGDSENAFHDNDKFSGTLSIADITESSVILKSSGFTRPIYTKRLYKGEYSDMRTNLVSNDGEHPLFQGEYHSKDTSIIGDEVILVSKSKDENGRNRRISLKIYEFDADNFKDDEKKRNRDDKCLYVFYSNDELKKDTSSRHIFIRNSLSLSDLASDVALEFDPVGISIIRDYSNTDVPRTKLLGKSKSSLFSKKTHGSYVGKRYSIDLDSRADVSEIIINGKSFRPDRLNTELEVPFNVPFYIGSGSDKTEAMVFRKRHQGDTLCLEYELPRYRYLSSNENQVENTLMITTSLFDTSSPDNLDLMPAYTDNILLFDVFDRQNNRNQLSPAYLSFASGESSKLLDYDFITSRGRSTDQRSLDYRCSIRGTDFSDLDNPSDSLAFFSKTGLMHVVPTIGNQGVSWMMSVENFKETTPFDSKHISYLLFAVMMVCSFLLVFRPESTRYYSIMEYSAYLVLIAFLTVRLFLMWRTTVFPPVTAISYYEFNHFRTAVPILWIIGAFGFFVTSVLAVKIWMYRRKVIKPDFPLLRNLLMPERNMYIAIVCSYLLGFMSSFVLPAERICNIMIPVAIAVVFEILIHWLYARTYIQDIKTKNLKDPIGKRRNPILMSAINLCMASGVTFVKDGGYGVMFIIFSILFLIYKFLDLRSYTPRNKNSSKATICKYLLFIFAIAIFAFYKDLFIFMFNRRLEFVLLAFVLILILAVLIIVVLDIPVNFRNAGWKAGALVLSAAVACAGLYIALGSQMDGKHLEYRIRVHMDTPENTLAYHIKSQEAQNKFMQASINGWILDEYTEIGKDVRVLGEDGAGYFKMQPQSKLGALWFAQTTDIVLSRFIIAEHSQSLAVLFIIAFVMMLAIGLLSRSEHRWTKMIMVMIPLLFATQAMLIWLANTGRFIFFGQDFPLISVTSKLSIIYFFFLLLILVVASLIEKMPHAVRSDERDWKIIDTNNFTTAFQIIFVFIFVMMIFLFKETRFIYEALFTYLLLFLTWQFYLKRRGNVRKKRTEDDEDGGMFSSWRAGLVHGILFATLAFIFFQLNKIGEEPEKMRGEYRVGELMTNTNSEIEIVNHHLKDYQKEHKMTLESDMYSQMAGFREYLDEQDLPFLDGDVDSTGFTRLIMDEFFKNGSRNNTVNNLLHARNERSYNSNGAARDTVVLALKADYFRLVLPKRSSMGWKGNIIEHQEQLDPQNVQSVAGAGSNKVILSGSSVYGGHDVLLVSAENSKGVRVIGADALVDVDSRSLPVACVNSTDVLLENGRKVMIPIDKVNYFARNVMINGQRTFLYPRGSELFWIRDFATQIQTAKNSTPKNKRDKKTFNDDVAVTLDGELVSSIYSIYMANAKVSGGDRTVVVADGDGYIKAMVDFRKRDEYRLNPNDSKKITEVTEDLMLHGEMGKTRERMYFENMATSPLRLGPGSSQKPLTWTAVSTGYNTGWWENLAISPLRSDRLYTAADAKSFSNKDQAKIASGRYLFRHFAGHRVQASFNSIKNDEGEGVYPITLDYFIRRSSNFYNGVLAYLGSFPVEGYYNDKDWLKVSEEYDGQSLFRERPDHRNAFQYDSLFPIMTIDKNRRKEIVFNAFLNKEFALDTTALLPLGLSRNLGLRPYTFMTDENGDVLKDGKHGSRRTSVKAVSLYPSVQRYRRNERNNRLEPVAAATPARSYFNLIVRRGNYQDKQLNENMVRSVAIGNNTAWQVSPLKMAEMYGRMIAMNRSYTLTLEPGNASSYEPFIIDDSWYSLNKYHEARSGLLIGMSQNFQSNAATALRGQAAGVRPKLVEIDEVQTGEVEDRYYIYGKTGTIDGKYSGIDMEDHLLAVVITDRKLTECSSDELENVRFYVVYFADYGGLVERNDKLALQRTSWAGIDRSILNAVINSRDFQNYMNASENSIED